MTPAPTPPERLLTVAEVAAWLRVHPKTLYKLARRGRVPCVRFVGSIRFDRGAVQRWLDSAGKEGR